MNKSWHVRARDGKKENEEIAINLVECSLGLCGEFVKTLRF